MKLETEILVNRFGQGHETVQPLVEQFESLEFGKKESFLEDLIFLIVQSDVDDKDIETAILNSKLKPTFTPCVLLKKGVNQGNLYRIIKLPENEHRKVLILFLHLFKVGYRRKFEIEKNDPNKWWFWDLSSENNIDKITSKFT